jgi:transcriptional regulator with XRE-family HTH domain
MIMTGSSEQQIELAQEKCLIIALEGVEMQAVTRLNELSTFCLNLRWMLFQRCKDPLDWAGELSRITRNFISFSRSHGLLMGGQPTLEEVRALADILKVDPEELQSVPIYARAVPVFRQNLAYLIDSIPHGQKDRVAKQIGITAPQLSRWTTGEIKPRTRNLRQLLKIHGIDPDLQLETAPLFLSMEPLSGYTQRQWVASRVQELPPAEIARIYPALRKLLRHDD